jgi:putative hemolysin
LVDGQYSILEFVKHFVLPSKEEYQTEFTTVAGLIMFESNRLPEVGEKFILEDLELEVIDKDGQRIDKILVTKLPIR